MQTSASWMGVLALVVSACSWNGPAAGATGPTVSLSWTPPPIRGGTLTVRDDGGEVLLVDRDRAAVHVLALSGHQVTDDRTYRLTHEARPERAIYAGPDRRLAVLADGRLVRLDPDAVTFVADACAGPRGMAWDAARERVWITCASGEVAGISLEEGAPPIRVVLEPDLGDVLVRGSDVWIAVVRRAQVLRIGAADGSPRSPVAPIRDLTGTDEPHAALRMIDAGAEVWLLHEVMRNGPVVTPSGWGGGTSCTGNSVTIAMSALDGSGNRAAAPVVASVPYASDVAFAASRGELAVASPSSLAPAYTGPNVVRIAAHEGSTCPHPTPASVGGQPTAVAFLPDGALLVQSREPGTLFVDGAPYPYAAESVRDTGHDLFHTGAVPGGVPCTACHIDGSSDGHVWDLGDGPRCTMTLRGGLTRTAPFHWDGSLTDLTELMGAHFPAPEGTTVMPDQVDAFAHWVDGLPGDPRPAIDPALIERGRALFASRDCARCHGDDAVTPMSTSVDFGDGAMQVPTLVDVGQQTPLGHDGCAATLDAVLSGACGWPGHTIGDASERAAIGAFLGVIPR